MDAAELRRWLPSVARLMPAQKADLLKALSAQGVATSDLESYLGWFRALDWATRSRVQSTEHKAHPLYAHDGWGLT